MRKSSNEILNIIEQILSPNGFTRRGATWARSAEGILQLVDLQKSSYGRQYYLNLGLWVEEAEPPPLKLREHDMHVRLRVDGALEKADRLRLAAALDLEGPLSTSDRHALITEVFKTNVLPWLNEWRSPAGVGRAILVAPLTGALVTREARALVPNDGGA